MGLREELLAQGCMEKKTRKNVMYYEKEVGEIVAKICTKCGELKVVGEYSNHKKLLGGKEPACKLCRKNYREEHREIIIEQNRNHYKNNRNRILGQQREYRKENQERVAEAACRYREKNKEIIVERNRKYYEKNTERELEKKRKYREENRAKIAEYLRKWGKENRDKRNLLENLRQARKKSLPDNFTNKQQNEVLSQFNYSCALTGELVSRTWDHAIPIAVGYGGTTHGNMYPLRGDLNSSKQDSNIFEWFNANRERFNLEQSRFDALIEYLADINEMTVEEYRDYVYWCHENPREINELEESK